MGLRPSFPAAHRPPDEEQHQREYAAGFDEEDPGVVHAVDSSPAARAARPIVRRFRRPLVLAALLLASCAAPRGHGDAQALPTPAGSGPATDRSLPAVVADGPGRPVESLPGWHEDTGERLHEALTRQCALPRPPAPWPALCAALPAPHALKDWIAARFSAWPLARDDGKSGLLTGYYEPVLSGSRGRERDGQEALYRPPADLVRGPHGTRLKAPAKDGEARHAGAPSRYPARAEIENGRLLAGHELVWLDDPVEAFFVHVQGSARVRLRDGSTMRVGFADHNGHPYHAIGRELIARGALAAATADADAIKAWLRTHPAQAKAVMHSNRRFIFFRELPGAEGGPPGALGVPLTPMRSVATDPAHVPPGALLFLDTTHPGGGAPLRRLVVSQDKGAAIVGAVRADLYWGSGDEAGRMAGRTREPARIWLLWPKGVTPSNSRPASG